VRAIADLGAWWLSETGLPLPLGGNVIRRDLDARFGIGALQEVARLLRRSIDFALAHRAESLAYARTFAPPISDADLDRYVSMYVSPLTVDARPRGVQAAEELFRRAAAAGLAPEAGPLDVVAGD
jgi:1,4-dihydroxy-6-naphthoate synthase